MEQLEGIEEIANRILQENPDPVVRFRILRDVLRVAPDANAVTEARRQMLTSRWVRELRNDQCKDGSWGRFHSRDSKIKKKIMTTEMGVDRGLALGLDATDQVFKPTVNYLSKLLDRSDDFPDPPEHDNR